MSVKVKVYGPVLLLFGPIGTFFSRLAYHLQGQGIKTYKIAFPLREFGFQHRDQIPFQGDCKQDFRPFLKELIIKKGIRHIFMYGDFIIPHKIAIEVGEELREQGVAVETWIFELGYLRPNYITLEPNRVNCNSNLNQSRDFYQQLPIIDHIPEARHESGLRWRKCWKAPTFILHSLTSYQISETEHKLQPRPKDVAAQLLGFIRKYKYQHTENQIRFKLFEGQSFFLVILQVASDSQLYRGSPYQSVDAFIKHTIQSFAIHAPNKARLFIKHHPRDRGYNNYKELINSLAFAYSASDRIFYLHDSPLAPIFRQRQCRGCILVNSSVGFQALFHGIPLKAMGKAPYNIEGLADQQDIDLFWSNPQPSDRDLFRKFYNYTLQTTQINGNFDGYFPFASVFKPVANLCDPINASPIPAISEKVNGFKSMIAFSFLLCKRLSLLTLAYVFYVSHWLARISQSRKAATTSLELGAEIFLKAFGIRVFMDRRDSIISNRSEIHIANHNSPFDVLLVQGYFRMPAATTAQLHLGWLLPGFRFAAQSYGHMLLDYRCKLSRLKTLLKSRYVLQRHKKLFIFPSGSLKTSINSRFSSSIAFLARQQNALVIPWTIHYFCDGKEVSGANEINLVNLLASRLTGPPITVICSEGRAFDSSAFSTNEEMTKCLRAFYHEKLQPVQD
jgi:capsular polysaccharide export protein